MNRIGTWAVRFYPGLLIGAAFTIFFWPVLQGKIAFLWDSYDYSYPLALYLRDSFKDGVFPLWNPFILSGEAMFAQPSVSAYQPLHLLIAIAPNWINSFYLFQLSLVSLAAIGAIGFFKFARNLGFRTEIATFGAVVVVTTFFGPLLGQLPVAFGISLFPWVANSVLVTARLERVSWPHLTKLALLGALFVYGSYFGIILYTCCFMVGFIPLAYFRASKPRLRVYLFHLSVAIVFSGLLAAPHLLAAAENRTYFYSSISKAFVPPDPRVRGVVLPRDHIVEIIPNEQTLIGVLTNSRNLSRDGAFWVIGPGLGVLLLTLFSLRYLKRRIVQLAWLSLIVSESYLLALHSAVFEFVYANIPLLQNIRYPVFSFPFVSLLMLLLALFSLSRITYKLKPNVRLMVVGLLAIEPLIFAMNTGLFHGRVPAIARAVSPAEFEKLSLSDRNPSTLIRSNVRALSDSKLLTFDDKDWIRAKRPTNHGYSTSDSPLYWYLKAAPFLSTLAFCPKTLVHSELPHELTNASMNSIRIEAAQLTSERAATPLAAADGGSCRVDEIQISPNSIKLSVYADTKSLLVITDKNYPGWRADLDGRPTEISTVNDLFKGIELPQGHHDVSLEFHPQSFSKGLSLALFAIIGLVVGNLFSALTSRRWRIKNA